MIRYVLFINHKLIPIYHYWLFIIWGEKFPAAGPDPKPRPNPAWVWAGVWIWVACVIAN